MSRVRLEVSAIVAALTVTMSAGSAAGPGAAEALVVNGSFEAGRGGMPQGWTLSGGKGRWTDGGTVGKRMVRVTGTGSDSNSWQSQDVGFSPGGVYRLRFRARRIAGAGGVPISGPGFCNRDLGGISSAWQAYASCFVAPRRLDAGAGRLRFGQWQVKGTVAFDAVELCPAEPVYRRRGAMVLGAGESVAARRYVFDARLNGPGRSHSRPLLRHQCRFNTSRWCFAPGSEVVYRHEIGPHKQTAATLDIGIIWYRGGRLAVSASRDGITWRPLGLAGKLGTATFAVPKSLLPAEVLFVRLAAAPGPASLQVGRYTYQAELDADAGALRGATNYVALPAGDPRLRVAIESLGPCLPGGPNTLVAHVLNTSKRAISASPAVRVAGPYGPSAAAAARPMELPPGKTTLELPFTVADVGAHRLTFTLGPAVAYRAEADFRVPQLYATSFGRLLPGSKSAADLWWSPSAWKISRQRPAPRKRGAAVLIRTAKNEAEAAQLVVRPSRRLAGLRVRVGALAGPDGATIGTDRVEVLRVRYVPVSRPTDHTGVAAPWPDPLVPLTGPLDLPAGRNQPLWVRVKPPRNTPAGLYKGTIALSAEGYRAEADLHVHVYDFALPNRMTCRTAFGFSPSLVWRYHNVTDPARRRTLLDKYFRNFSDHHISPYNPALLDPIKVTWAKPANRSDRTPRPRLDFAAWDKAMARAIDEYHFNTFRVSIPGMGGGTFHARHEPSLLGFGEKTPEYQAAFGAYCRTLQEHLRAKGWLDEAFVYWFDEPAPRDYKFVNDGFARLKLAAPDLHRMLTEQVEEALVGGPDIWCPVTPNYDHAAAEARRRAGESFWWYVCTGPKAPYCTLFIDHPATELRVWLWQTWQRKIDGILVWQSNYWTSRTAYTDPKRPQNPYEDPMGWVSGYSTAKGTRRPWGNGDGRFIYPPESAADGRATGPVMDGPVDSIRWEMLRDGIEDYEYLAMLRRLLKRRAAALDASARARLEALLTVPPEITSNMTTFTHTPDPILKRRHQIAKAIEELTRRTAP